MISGPLMMISVAVSGFICLASVFGSTPLALAAGVFITIVVLVLSFIPLALAAGVFIAIMVLVSGFVPLAWLDLAAAVFIAFTDLASALSAGNLTRLGVPAKNLEFRRAMVVVGSARVADGDGELRLTLMLMMMVVVMMSMATDHGEPE